MPRRDRALLHDDRRRHGRPRLRVQAAVRPLRRRIAPRPTSSACAATSARRTPTSCSSSTPSAATSARPPSTTPARRSIATPPTPSPSTRTSAPTPSRRSSPPAGCSRCATRATRAAPSCRSSTSTATRCTSGRPMVATRWQALGDAGLVVGATYPDAAGTRSGSSPATCRSSCRHRLPGRRPPASVPAGSTAPGAGLLCSSSRHNPLRVPGDDFADGHGRAMATTDAINAAVG